MSDVVDEVAPRPAALGAPVLTARLRMAPEDFLVEEVLGFAPAGEGEHLFLTIEKRSANTHFVAQQLARWAGVPDHAVGYAGLKDRHAVTRQAFTVHLPKRVSPALETLAHAEFRLIDATWHSRKLPRGALRGNRFALCLREVCGERGAIDVRLGQIRDRGVPNAFGEQRFGRDGGNLDAARAMFSGRRVSREKRSILLSAARSALFNAVVDERIRRDAWDRALPGEVFMLDGSHSVFGPEPLDETLAARMARFDIHPSAPMWGAGALRSGEMVRQIEEAVAQAEPDLVQGLERAGLKQERRALRVRPGDFSWQWQDDALRLGFFLPAGSYATAVLDVLGEIRDVAREGVAAALLAESPVAP